MQRHFGQIRTTTHLPLPKARTIRKRCSFDLDRFEPPHQFETATNGKYKIALFFQWTDPNYRKPNNDLLKTKKKPSAYIAKCLSAKRLAFFIAERMITDERNHLKGRPNCARSTSRWAKTVVRSSLVFRSESHLRLRPQI